MYYGHVYRKTSHYLKNIKKVEIQTLWIPTFLFTLNPNVSPSPYGKISILTYTNRRRSDGVAVYFRQGIGGQETGDI